MLNLEREPFDRLLMRHFDAAPPSVFTLRRPPDTSSKYVSIVPNVQKVFNPGHYPNGGAGQNSAASKLV